MDSDTWLDLCYRSLGVPEGVDDRRRVATRMLLEAAGEPVDVLGVGAAEAAIDLVVRYGEAGKLDEVLLGWEQAELFAAEIGSVAAADVGNARATACAKALLQAIVRRVEDQPLPE